MRATRTVARTSAPVRSKPRLIAVKMARVKTSTRTMETAPKSERTYSATSSAPAPTAGRTWRSVTPQAVRHGPRPSERDTSSCAGSDPVSAAATGR